jgi:Family of unknown function (DUF5317)
VEFHLGVVALLAIPLQLAAIEAPLGSDDLPRRILFVASYVLLIVFAAVNLRRPGIAVLGVGLVLNFLAIVSNGGLMPTTPEDYAKYSWPQDATIGSWIPHTKDVLLERKDVRLYYLGDHLRWDDQALIRVFSIGDLVIMAGLALTVAELALPRVRLKQVKPI